ncbi:MAG TPA: 2,3-diphosphoglycerate-dependent phosphoglycerate mutase [Geminicoccaceae bacterium]|nr:2,3-diphosphoglycerate-dependent phosphoglycerate mutase [Geminicoccus sp.]HMU48567.1 2,3-diphosphoglycerate-dependent phosphoglycerate mutase [Geminicoccaceae bacterium]
MPTLVMCRHGESDWNRQNRFTGWVDVDLSETGEAQARKSGRLLRDTGIQFDRTYSSVLRRAIRTLWILLEEIDQLWLPQQCLWRLNERHYGALQGLDKAETAAKHGDEQVLIWRRSFDTPPPPLDAAETARLRADRRYAEVPTEELPLGESLKLTLARVMPCWSETIEPELLAGRNVLIGAHGNSLRALAKHLFGISDADILKLEIPTGNPLLVELDDRLAVKSARYLDTERAGPLPSLG